MALIKCPECSTEVSDKAEKCPKCAYPILRQPIVEKTQTIELVSKKYKKQMIYTVLITIIGAVIVISSGGSESSGGTIFGVLLALSGLIWLSAIKIKIWWHHK